MEEGVVIVTEAASRLGLTERTLYRWIDKGKISTIEPTEADSRRYVPISEIHRLKRQARKKQPRQLKSSPAAESAQDRKSAAAGKA